MRFTIALNAMFVERVALIAPATVAADRVLASAVLAHARKLDALIDVLTLGEAIPAWAQLRVRWRTYFRTQLAFVAAPGATHGTATDHFREMTLYWTGALTVAIVQVARFLPGVDASAVCNRRIEGNHVKRLAQKVLPLFEKFDIYR